MKVIAVVSAKGGVGKTSVAANLSVALSGLGRTVLGVDLDPQNALGLHFGLKPDEARGSAPAEFARKPWTDFVLPAPNGAYILPYGNVDEEQREEFEQFLDQTPNWLSEHLRDLGMGRDDIVVIDTPPGPSVYMRQALRSADLVLIVSLPDAASYATLALMQRLVDSYCKHNAQFLGHFHVVNQADSGKQLSSDVTRLMRAKYGQQLLGIIHQDQAVCEALACDQTVLEYDEHSQACADFIDCAQNLLTHLD